MILMNKKRDKDHLKKSMPRLKRIKKICFSYLCALED